MVKIGKFEYFLSDRKDKKLKVKVNDKWVHFGSNLEHYYDKTGLLDPKLNHKDKERRKNFLKRSKGIKNKKGEYTWNKPAYSNFHARTILW